MSDTLKPCLVCNSEDVQISSLDDEGIYFEWICENCGLEIRGDNVMFLYIDHITETKKMLDKTRLELKAATKREKVLEKALELLEKLCVEIKRESLGLPKDVNIDTNYKKNAIQQATTEIDQEGI